MGEQNRAVLKASSERLLNRFKRLSNGQDSIDGNPKRTLATRQALALMNAAFG